MHNGSIADAERALRSDPWSADLTYGLVMMYFVHGNQAQANELITRLLVVAPNSAIAKRLHP
jgi:hypothetical protein